jgi:hypothetical protein
MANDSRPLDLKRPPATARQKELMLMVALRRQQTFETLYGKLQPDHLNGRSDRPLALLWAAAIEFWEEYEELPHKEELLSLIEARLEEAEEDYLDDDEYEDLDALVTGIYEVDKKQLRHKLAVRVMQQLLEERLRNDLMSSVDGDVPVDLPELLQVAVDSAASIKALDAGSVSIPFPDRVEEMKPVEKIPTGLDFLDFYLNGGQSPGEVYALSAPYGTCKTTIACSLVAERAKWEQMITRNSKGERPPKTVYLVCWEEELDSLRVRLLSYLARVDRTLIEEHRLNELSSRDKGDYKPAERKRYEKMLRRGKKPPGEKERLEAARKQMNRNLRLIDFTGATKEYREFSANMASGVAAVIAQDQQSTGYPGVSLVVCDYAQAAADLKIQHDGLNPDRAMRHLVGRFPLQLKNKIAAPMQCPAWVMGQVDTDTNSLAAGRAPKKTGTAEAKNFFENANFGFLIGTKSKEDMCVFTNAKQRRAEQKRDTIIHIDGKHCRVTDASDRYILENSKIVSKNDFNKLHDEHDGDVHDTFDSDYVADGIGVD